MACFSGGESPERRSGRPDWCPGGWPGGLAFTVVDSGLRGVGLLLPARRCVARCGSWQAGRSVALRIVCLAQMFQVCTLAPAYSLTREVGLPGLTAGYMGLGAAFYLSRSAGKAGRRLAMASIPLVFALSWYLPGVGLALLGLALSRQMVSVVIQSFVLVYLFADMVFYYYSLAVPFSLKSLYLVATGLGLLAVALVLWLWQAKHTAGEAGHA